MPARRKGQAAVEKKAQALSTLTVTYVPVGDIKPNNYNPNRQNEHEFTMLCKSIEEDGFTQPVIIAEDGTIVDGEHRWRAAQKVGLKEIPVVRVPMDAAQARIATLRHNRARGSEDIEMAVEVLRDLEKLGALDWAADSLDMSDEELQRLMADIAPPEAIAGEEFTNAWAPMNRGGGTREGDLSGSATASSTPGAMSAAREQEERLKAAKSEEERQKILEDRRLFRLVLTFTGDEADVVREALGETPAARVLEWCQAARPVVMVGEPAAAS